MAEPNNNRPPGVSINPAGLAPSPKETERTAVNVQRARTGDTVTVACKVPCGLRLRIYDLEEQVREVNGTVLREKVAVPLPDEYVLNGTAINMGAIQAGNLPEHQIIGGYGLTSDIPRDFWERWLHDNRTTDLVKNRVVFACDDNRAAASEARNSRAIKSGLEPVDPTNLPREYGARRLRGGAVSAIQRGSGGDNDTDRL